jgi:predicted TIM-barrel fold metal-dependent hydrolase
VHAAASTAVGWDCHVHVFDTAAPIRSGHYTPPPQPLSRIESLAEAQGLQRLVLVQPSVYGHDHAVLLQALAQGRGRHRGVAVLAPDVDDSELDRLHDAGVRGVRFNRVSPVGHAGDPTREVGALAPRLRERGWHMQWYVDAAQLPLLATLQSAAGLPFVLDHVGGLHAVGHDADAAWAAAQRLADRGAWIKLSGWYRAAQAMPDADLRSLLRRVTAMFGAHTVWGSDWPHTHFAADNAPPYASLLDALRSALEPAVVQSVLSRHPLALYCS